MIRAFVTIQWVASCLILSLMMTLILLGQLALENMERMRTYELLVWIGQKVFRSY